MDGRRCLMARLNSLKRAKRRDREHYSTKYSLELLENVAKLQFRHVWAGKPASLQSDLVDELNE